MFLIQMKLKRKKRLLHQESIKQTLQANLKVKFLTMKQLIIQITQQKRQLIKKMG